MIPALLGLLAEGAGGLMADAQAANSAVGGALGGKASSDALSSISTDFGKINEAAKPLTDVLGKMWATFQAGVSKVVEVTEAIAGLVKIANPAAFKQYSNAVEDVQGVFGGMLLPVLQSITAIIRSAGDDFANMDGLQHLFQLLAQGISSAWSVLGPIFDGLVGILDSLAKALSLAFELIGEAMKPVIFVAQLLAKAFQAIFGTNGSKKSMGAAAGNATFGTFEDVSRKAQSQAFALTMGGGTGDKAVDQRDEMIMSLRLIATAVDVIGLGLPGLATKLLFGS